MFREGDGWTFFNFNFSDEQIAFSSNWLMRMTQQTMKSQNSISYTIPIDSVKHTQKKEQQRLPSDKNAHLGNIFVFEMFIHRSYVVTTIHIGSWKKTRSICNVSAVEHVETKKIQID